MRLKLVFSYILSGIVGLEAFNKDSLDFWTRGRITSSSAVSGISSDFSPTASRERSSGPVFALQKVVLLQKIICIQKSNTFASRIVGRKKV